MTTSEPKLPRPSALPEAAAAAERGPWLPGVYRLEAARSLLKALSGKNLLEPATEGPGRRFTDAAAPPVSNESR